MGNARATRRQQAGVEFGANSVQKRNETDPDAPADCLPVQADASEFGRFGALVAI